MPLRPWTVERYLILIGDQTVTIAKLRDEVGRLQAEVERLKKLVPPPPEPPAD